MIEALRKVIKRMHYPLEVMLTCVRWYAAYPLSLRHIEEMMQERGVLVDHSTVHRWAIKILPVLAAVSRRRKRPVGTSWRMDETYSTPSQRGPPRRGLSCLSMCGMHGSMKLMLQ
jgi:putative transposase